MGITHKSRGSKIVGGLKTLYTGLTAGYIEEVDDAPVNAAAATALLTLAGNILDGEDFEIGDDTYEVDTDGTVTEGNIQVDVSTHATASSQTLTLAGAAKDGDEIEIGDDEYQLDSDGSVTEGKIAIDIAALCIAATGLLTLAGDAKDGDEIEIGTDEYQLDSDGSVSGGRIAIDISDLCVAASGTFTITDTVSDTETVVIGDDTYEFDTGGSVDPGNILVDISEDAGKLAAAAALVAAINDSGTENFAATDDSDTDGVVTIVANTPGTDSNGVSTTDGVTDGSWAEATTLGGEDATNTDATPVIAAAINENTTEPVTAVESTDTVEITHNTPGTDGNSVTTTETMENGSWADATLVAGADALNTAAVVKIAEIINAEGTEPVTAESSTNTVVVTHDTPGTIGDTLATTETMDNGSWGAATLAGGADCSNSDGATVIVATIKADATEDIDAAVTNSTNVTVTANTKGTAANAVEIDENLANGTWDDTTFTGGVDGTPGTKNKIVRNGNFIYLCATQDITVTNDNWRRSEFSSY